MKAPEAGFFVGSLPRKQPRAFAPSKPWHPAQATAQQQRTKRPGRRDDPVCLMSPPGCVPGREVQ
jgi:hypothetical protein